VGKLLPGRLRFDVSNHSQILEQSNKQLSSLPA